MSFRISFALISGAIAFLAFWGIALASVEGNSVRVDADGYGIYQPTKLWLTWCPVTGLDKPVLMSFQDKTSQNTAVVTSRINIDTVGFDLRILLRCVTMNDYLFEQSVMHKKIISDPHQVTAGLIAQADTRTNPRMAKEIVAYGDRIF